FAAPSSGNATITIKAGGVRTGTSTTSGLPKDAVFQAAGNGTTYTSTSSTDGTFTISVPKNHSYTVSLKTAPARYYGNSSEGTGTGGDSVASVDYSWSTGSVTGNITIPGSTADATNTNGSNTFSGQFAASLKNPAAPAARCGGLRVAFVLDLSPSMNTV